MSSSNESYAVLVTGGAGFLGQHVIGLLQTRADYVTEIRVLDVVPYVNKLDYEARKPVRQYVGSINDIDLVTKACKGVQCVMHIASIVDISLLPDMELSHKINVLGTQTVIDACRAADVRRLIYCSSLDVAIGKDNIYNGTESSVTRQKQHYFPVYGQTKAMAEDLVLRANDSQLQTVSLRPMALYGELDMLALGQWVHVSNKFGAFPRFGCGKGRIKYVYVGNVAWAFVCTDKRLQESNTNSIAGNAFFIGDDNKPKNLNDFYEPICLAAGCKPLPFVCPQWVIIYFLYALYLIFVVISTVHRVNFPFGIAALSFQTKTYLFSHEKASKVIGYRPLFTIEEAKARTVKFMKSL